MAELSHIDNIGWIGSVLGNPLKIVVCESFGEGKRKVGVQGLMQDLNLGGSSNVVNFMNVLNLVCDPRYSAEGSRATL